jgi:hypothetical protein
MLSGHLLEPLMASLEVELNFSQQAVVIEVDGLGQILSLCEDAGSELGVQLVACFYCLCKGRVCIVKDTHLLGDTAMNRVGLFVDRNHIDG